MALCISIRSRPVDQLLDYLLGNKYPKLNPFLPFPYPTSLPLPYPTSLPLPYPTSLPSDIPPQLSPMSPNPLLSLFYPRPFLSLLSETMLSLFSLVYGFKIPDLLTACFLSEAGLMPRRQIYQNWALNQTPSQLAADRKSQRNEWTFYLDWLASAFYLKLSLPEIPDSLMEDLVWHLW